MPATECGGDSLGDFVLHREQVIDRPIVALGPDLAAGSGFDELDGHANLVAHRSDAALENIFHVEVATDLADVEFEHVRFLGVKRTRFGFRC